MNLTKLTGIALSVTLLLASCSSKKDDEWNKKVPEITNEEVYLPHNSIKRLRGYFAAQGNEIMLTDVDKKTYYPEITKENNYELDISIREDLPLGKYMMQVTSHNKVFKKTDPVEVVPFDFIKIYSIDYKILSQVPNKDEIILRGVFPDITKHEMTATLTHVEDKEYVITMKTLKGKGQTGIEKFVAGFEDKFKAGKYHLNIIGPAGNVTPFKEIITLEGK